MLLEGFIAGTTLMTQRGAVAVESLRPGDRVLTLPRSGQAPLQPILRLRQARLLADPLWPPLRIRAGAFADQMPARDLLLLPGYRVTLHPDGVAVPVDALANGSTIARDAVTRLTRIEVELAFPATVLADGLAVSSGSTPESAAAGVEAMLLRAELLARAETLGWRTVDDPALRVETDDMSLDPVEATRDRVTFQLPAGDGPVRLISRTMVPMERNPSSGDARRLGIAVASLSNDGIQIDLSDQALGAGFLPPETDGGTVWRWTDGSAQIQLPPRKLFSTLSVGHLPWLTYWQPPAQGSAAVDGEDGGVGIG